MSLPAGKIYSGMQRWVHWLMALMIISLLIAIEIKGNFPKNDPRVFQLVEWHKQAGLWVLFLVWFRLYWRYCQQAPEIIPPLSPLARVGSHGAHIMLYLMMIGIPVLGVLQSQAKGGVINFMGWPLPVFLDESVGLPYALPLKTLHQWLGNAMMVLVGIHFVFALFHHWIRRDNTLTRMLGIHKPVAQRSVFQPPTQTGNIK